MKSSKKCKINYLFSSKKWRELDFDLKVFTKIIAIEVLNEVKAFERVKGNILELTINLADDKQLQQLNKDFLQKDHPTNVLSFPSNELNLLNGDELIDNYIGDIAISYNRIKIEASEQDKSFKNHYAHIAVHAILHLMGYDHIKEIEAEYMEAMEIKILDNLGISDPYKKYI